ncbi:glycosyltransferase family 8 protein [Erwinia sp. S43]|uniref:glycosyltransferase family 8 protein n=1 Tax=unclassified Erwinia TaxID=2622719 RepID=UPI00190DA51C|nr:MULTISPECIES: glycosyltransferase family 8 protein [unclassified Erwinia]MBK0033288.1 glycosyltransferase family 8 protein [Erwinia sp. S43]MCW1874986.1 glycosyltransferase family 8 protein [Erwinia sp. INIA01]
MMAWTTLLTQPGYLIGVRALAKSLQVSGSRYPLMVMVTGNIGAGVRATLEQDGCLVREVDPVSPDPTLENRYANARFAEVWTKLAAWTFTEFERLVFLDADMLVTQNMDEVFALPLSADHIAACHACRCNPNRIASYPSDWTPENCFYSWCKGEEHVEQPDKVDNYLNGGFLLLTPDKAVFDAMMAQLAALDDLSTYLFAEQDFLNQFYRDRWQPLPWVYNALKTLPHQHPDIWNDRRVKNIHYIIDKPWEKTPKPGDRYYELNRKWWLIADQLN